MASQIAPETLNGLELFRDFSRDEIQQILAVSSDVSLAAREILFEAGGEERCLYVLLAGSMRLELEAPFTSETVLAELGPTEVFGESTFFHAAPHSATAECITDARLVRLARADFDRLAQSNPNVARHLGANAAEILAARLQHTDTWVADMLQAQQDARIHARWREFRESIGHSFRMPGRVTWLGGGLS